MICETESLACAVLAHQLDGNSQGLDELLGDNDLARAIAGAATTVLLWEQSSHLTGVPWTDAPSPNRILATRMRAWSAEILRYGLDLEAGTT